MSLNIKCANCNEFYKSSDPVYSTTECGHLFHRECLFRWLARSSTCPQCHQSCNKRRVHRVYLNFGESAELDDGANAIPSNIQNWSLLQDTKCVPDGAIKCGNDPEGNDAYVARVYFSEDLLPANFIPAKEGAYAPWNCSAHFIKEDIEVLLDADCSWIPASNGNVPQNAIVTGFTETGEDLYTGRAQYEGILLGGKVHRSHGVLYMPFNGKEVNTKEYEVLVRNGASEQETTQKIDCRC